MNNENVLADLVTAGGRVIARAVPIWLLGLGGRGQTHAAFGLEPGILTKGEIFRLIIGDGREPLFQVTLISRGLVEGEISVSARLAGDV